MPLTGAPLSNTLFLTLALFLKEITTLGTDQSELKRTILIGPYLAAKITISLFASFIYHSQNLQIVATTGFTITMEFITMNSPGLFICADPQLILFSECAVINIPIRIT